MCTIISKDKWEVDWQMYRQYRPVCLKKFRFQCSCLSSLVYSTFPYIIQYSSAFINKYKSSILES